MSIRKLTQDYASPDDRLAVFHLIISLGLYVFALTLGTVFYGNWPVMAGAVLLFTGAVIRLFGIQHDCGHYSYFSIHRFNVRAGVLLGALTHNPFHAMRYNHNRHHAYVGDLDRMEAHEVLTWTVAQWQAAGFWQKTYYRIYRSAPVIFVIGPLFILLIRYRFPKNCLKTGLGDVAMQNALMVANWGLIYTIGGWAAFKFYVIATLIASCLGVFMVYVGHNHEETYWSSGPEYDFEDAALQGASVIRMGPLFDFLTFNFAYHDLHHLNHKVPAYKLRACHRALEPHLSPRYLSFWTAVQCIQWKLWDEDRGRMVRFRDVRETVPMMQPAE